MEKEVIWKYEIKIDDQWKIEMPAHAEILHLGVQDDKAYIWVKVNPYNKATTRRFATIGTGHPVKIKKKDLSYVGSYQLSMGFVGHIFEIL